MKIHVLRCGYIRIAKSLLHAGGLKGAGKALVASGRSRVTLPVSSYVIEHKTGLYLVDTGICREISPEGVYDRKAAEKVLGRHLTALYRPYVPAGMAVNEQLADMGIKLSDIKAVLITNFDIDHVAGMRHVQDAGLIVVPEEEAYWSVRTKYAIRQNRSLWEPYDHERMFYRGHRIGPVNKAIDITGDRSLMMVSLPGYTDGQAGIVAYDGKRYVVIASDAAYSASNMSDMTAAGLAADEKLQIRTLRWVASAAVDPDCAAVLFNHDISVVPGVMEV